MGAKVKFPEMRAEVIVAVTALAVSDYQRRFWGRTLPSGGYEDLSMAVHALYYDNLHLPHVEESIGAVLINGAELERLKTLDLHLGPMIEELDNAPDTEYLKHRNWPAVVRAPQLALSAMILGQ